MSVIDQIELHNLQSECVVLLTLMTAADSFELVADTLTAKDFYSTAHRTIFESICDLHKQGRTPDLVLVADHLLGRHLLTDCGGEAYLMDMARNISPAPYSIANHAKLIADLRMRRDAEQALKDALAKVRDNRNTETGVILSDCSALLAGAADSGTNAQQEATSPSEAILAMFERAHRKDSKGWGTGLIEVDNKTTSLSGGKLVVIAARPAMGKSVALLNIADHHGQESGKPFLVFQMEMDDASMMARIISSRSSVCVSKIATGSWDEAEWARVQNAADAWQQQGNVLFYSKAGIDPTELSMMAKRVSRKHGGLSGIGVDYIQLMRLKNHKGNRENEVSEITRSLKILAMDLGVPVFALSQLNRGLESRPNKRPMLSDLRESGAIEQDADIVWALYRDEVYFPDSQAKGTAEWLFLKQREGSTGAVRVGFEGQYSRFTNLMTGYGLGDE